MPQETPGPVEEPRFNQEQYDFLKQCSEKGAEGIAEWNQWRLKHPECDVLLEGADLSGCYLKGAYLYHGDFKGRTDHRKMGGQVHLETANLWKANLDKANLSKARLNGANLKEASIREANLRAYLMGAKLWFADLTGSDLWRAHLENADFYGARLRRASFCVAQVDWRTLIAQCEVDGRTDFAGVALENACVEPGLRQVLEYNVRRIGWERWYEGRARIDWHRYRRPEDEMAQAGNQITASGQRLRPTLKRFVWLFWSISDYGRSTCRIVAVFFGLALAFAAIYYLLGALDYYLLGDQVSPGIVSSLFSGREGSVPGWLVPLRAIYFSVVTMTTLGFGDMHANCRSLIGHLLLMVQVILGYVLLGALVTRLAALFTAGGPAGRFSEPERTRPT